MKANIAEAVDIAAVAAEALAALDHGRSITPFSSRLSNFDLAAAYQVTAAVRRMREARGEVPVGRKIGFTNRTIWNEYNVHEPNWGYMYAHTVHDLAESGEAFSLAGLVEPRIEPEIMFGLAVAPAAGMDEHALLDCVDWVAHGYEIVQSIFPAWQFSAPDTIAAFGLHGALLIGPRHFVAGKAEELEPCAVVLRDRARTRWSGGRSRQGRERARRAAVRAASSRRFARARPDQSTARRRRDRHHRNTDASAAGRSRRDLDDCPRCIAVGATSALYLSDHPQGPSRWFITRQGGAGSH